MSVVCSVDTVQLVSEAPVGHFATDTGAAECVRIVGADHGEDSIAAKWVVLPGKSSLRINSSMRETNARTPIRRSAPARASAR